MDQPPEVEPQALTEPESQPEPTTEVETFEQPYHPEVQMGEEQGYGHGV